MAREILRVVVRKKGNDKKGSDSSNKRFEKTTAECEGGKHKVLTVGPQFTCYCGDCSINNHVYVGSLVVFFIVGLLLVLRIPIDRRTGVAR